MAAHTYEKGDVAWYWKPGENERAVLVSGILTPRGSLTATIYEMTCLDTQKVFSTPGCWLIQPTIVELGNEANIQELQLLPENEIAPVINILDNEPIEDPTAIPPPPKKGRFAEVSEEDLDNLAMARMSTNA